LNVQQFASKWKAITLSEIAVAQSHFIDVCTLVGHPAPTDCDPKGEFFTFEIKAEKPDGEPGRADAWYKGKFIWEYKRPGSNLRKAYNQLLLYRESLGNPPLLITSDTHDILIHTNFTKTATETHKVDLERLERDNGLDLLKRAFNDPDSFKPSRTQEHVTQATAETFVEVANTLQKWATFEDHKTDSERLAHFITRLLFSMFAEDMGLLPENLFTHIVNEYKQGTTTHLADFILSLRQLFSTMKTGGIYGYLRIMYFNGGLFDDEFVPDLPTDILHSLGETCKQDWSNIDPSIFGTLFERIIDISKRAQLGAHYTSKDEISLVVEPVLMYPLRTKWQGLKLQVRDMVTNGQLKEGYALLQAFSNEIAGTRVLDPACGSGNFLYVSLLQLLDLQKEVITFAVQNALPVLPLTVNPSQLYGIELNPYAHELAQITVWIGYLQWRLQNGFANPEEPILHPLYNIEKKDAILDTTFESTIEPMWPEVDVIIGNPPFLGSRKIRPTLGDQYLKALKKVYSKRISGIPDLVCFWFVKALNTVKEGKAKRVGLLATQAIRGGTNRRVLDEITKEGKIFMAWSDRDWVLDGANVHVSIIGFDNGSEMTTHLDGQRVAVINSDLTSGVDLSLAGLLKENEGIGYQGVVLRGSFDIPSKLANQMIEAKNSSGAHNGDVIRRRVIGKDVTEKPRDGWVIDFGVEMSEEDAKKYEWPYRHIRDVVYEERKKTNNKDALERWWIHWRTRKKMREVIATIPRYIATPRVGKHRVFAWVDSSILPDNALVIFARSDDYFFGVLHSRVHELWARRKGTQLRDRESGFRYSVEYTFDTFPFPWPVGTESNEDAKCKKIAYLAVRLNTFRMGWLNPTGVGVILQESIAKKRTLTSLYNALGRYHSDYKAKIKDANRWKAEVASIISLDEIEELGYIHDELNKAVIDSYGWTQDIEDEAILSELLLLNLNRPKSKITLRKITGNNSET
jgi:type II restriction/modification system DNA methylase subunit YeeA